MATSIAAILSPVSQVFTSAIGWVGTVATTIVETPLLLMFCTISLVGLGVGLFKRLINC